MIIIGADHGGYTLKEEIKKYLQEINEDVVDVGAYKIDELDDFSTFVKKMITAFDNNKDAKIIAICGTGVGMCIGLNKHKGIFCADGHNEYEVKMARQHNNINALTFGGRTHKFEACKKLIDTFLNTPFLEGKYLKRMLEIENSKNS